MHKTDDVHARTSFNVLFPIYQGLLYDLVRPAVCWFLPIVFTMFTVRRRVQLGQPLNQALSTCIVSIYWFVWCIYVLVIHIYIYIEIIRNQCSNTPCCHESDRPHQTKSQAPLARCPGQGDAVSSTYNGLLSQNWYGPKAWIQFTQTTGDDSWTNFETLLWGGWQCGGSPCPLHLQDWIHPLCTLPVL